MRKQVYVEGLHSSHRHKLLLSCLPQLTAVTTTRSRETARSHGRAISTCTTRRKFSSNSSSSTSANDSGSSSTVGGNGTKQQQKVALVMGVANQRSIAWACVQSFLEENYHVIITHQDRFQDKVHSLVTSAKAATAAALTNNHQHKSSGRILGNLTCDVQTDLPQLFSERIPQLLWESEQEDDKLSSSTADSNQLSLDSIVHCIAYGDVQMSLREVTWDVYSQAQHISAFSFLETAQCAMSKLPSEILLASQPQGISLTALSYLGAVRALYPYHVMGPAKAALEALVRQMALEFGPNHPNTTTTNKNKNNTNDSSYNASLPFLRVNVVSAGPIATLSARGGIANFGALQQMVSQTSPLGRPVQAEEVAQTIVWIAQSPAITGQTIYVDGGFSSIVPIIKT
ncbi:hypothetical protein ACA910_017579 [Epithemia clementina (nom. ined.)]